jgi:hypothetical protein
MTIGSPSTSRLRRFGGPVACTLAVVAAVAQLGCFKPNIVDGGLKCNLEAGVGKAPCPEGFKCEASSGTCKRHPSDAGVVDMKPDVPNVDAPDDRSDVGDTLPDCFMPRANCTATPDAGICDPFCQTGCGCLEKCSVNTAGAVTCNLLKSGQVRGIQQPCEVQAPGSPDQIDQCSPGLFCLEDSCTSGGGGGRCYQFCRGDNECDSAPCNRDAGGGFKFCDVPFDDCSPLPPPLNSGCPGTGLTCYIATSDVSKTLCDCQFSAALRENDVCTRSRECFAGLVCVQDQLGTNRCTRVCRLAAPSPGDCPVGTCRTLTDNGKTNATFGFCR